MDHVSPAQLVGVLMTGMGNDGAAGDGPAACPRAAGPSPKPKRPPSSGACPANWWRPAARTGCCRCRRSPAGCEAGALTCRSIRKTVIAQRPPPQRAAGARRGHERGALGGGARRGRQARRRRRCWPTRWRARAIRACARRSSPAWRAWRRRKAPRPWCLISGRTTPACAPAPSTRCGRCRRPAGPICRLCSPTRRRRPPAGCELARGLPDEEANRLLCDLLERRDRKECLRRGDRSAGRDRPAGGPAVPGALRRRASPAIPSSPSAIKVATERIVAPARDRRE